MPREPSAPVRRDQAKRNASPAVARAYPLDVDRPKRIDQYLDYFGSGEESGPSPRLAPRGQPSQCFRAR